MHYVRLAALAWRYRKEIGLAVVAVIFLLFTLLAMLGGVFAIPLASDDQVQLYAQAVNELKRDKGLTLDYRQPLAIDAVQLNQDFSEVTLETIRQTVALFVTTTTEPGEPCEEGTPNCTCTTAGNPPATTCRLPDTEHHELRSMEQVMTHLGFTAEQVEIALTMISIDPESGSCLAWTPRDGVYLWPAYGPITSCFGSRWDPVEGGYSQHYGIDVAAPEMTPVKAAHSGTVNLAGYAGNYGNLVILIATDGSIHTWYGHLHAFNVTRGQYVQAGDILGYVGNTGKSTGPHLHFETRPHGGDPVDPITLYP